MTDRCASRTTIVTVSVETPPVDGLATRLFQLFGAKRVEDAVPVEGGTEWATVPGFEQTARVNEPGRTLWVNLAAEF